MGHKLVGLSESSAAAPTPVSPAVAEKDDEDFGFGSVRDGRSPSQKRSSRKNRRKTASPSALMGLLMDSSDDEN
jgi:hypothetical protein